jgi:hypothetical protein
LKLIITGLLVSVIAAGFAATAAAGDSISRQDLDGGLPFTFGDQPGAASARDHLTNRESGAIGGSDGTFQIIALAGTSENKFSGTFQYSDGANGDTLDLERDFGLRKESTERFAGQLRMGAFRLAGSYQSYEMNGRGTRQFTFGAFTFNTATQTRVEVTHYSGELGFSFGIGPIEFGLGLGAHVFDMSFRVTGTEAITGTTRTEEESFTGPVPVLAVYAGFDLMGVAIEPTLHIIKSPKISGIEGMMYDLSVMARIFPLGMLSVGAEAGYSFMNVKKEDTSSATDSTNGDIDLTNMRLSLVVGVSF